MIIGINGRVGSGKDTVGRIIQYLIRDKQGDGFSNNVKLEDTLNLTLSDPSHSGWEIKKYAAKLKQIASILTGIPVEKFEDQDFKKTSLSHGWDIVVEPAFQYVDVAAIPGLLKAGYTIVDPVKTRSGCGRGVTIAVISPKETEQFVVRTFLQKLGTEAIRYGIHTNAWVNALMADYNPEGFWPEEAWKTKIPNWIITDCRFPNEAQAIKDKGGIVIRVTRPGENLADLHPSETSLDGWEFDYMIENSGTIAQLKDNVAIFLHKNNLL